MTSRVWIQLVPFKKLIQVLTPWGGNARKESGGALSGILGGLLEDWSWRRG